MIPKTPITKTGSPPNPPHLPDILVDLQIPPPMSSIHTLIEKLSHSFITKIKVMNWKMIPPIIKVKYRVWLGLIKSIEENIFHKYTEVGDIEYYIGDENLLVNIRRDKLKIQHHKESSESAYLSVVDKDYDTLSKISYSTEDFDNNIPDLY